MYGTPSGAGTGAEVKTVNVARDGAGVGVVLGAGASVVLGTVAAGNCR